MQKKIIALAIAAAFSAPAFADTNVYGLVDAAVANITADGRQSDMLAVSGGLATSRIGVNGSEDLGNGLKAVVNLEYGLDVETNSTVGLVAGATALSARQQMLALAGGFGTVATGYLQTTGFDFGKSFDPTAGSTVSPLGNATKGGKFLIGAVAADARASRALAYISPNMSGFTVALNYSTDAAGGIGNLAQPDGTTGKTTASLVSVNYAAGPLAAAVVVAGNHVTSEPDTSVGENAIGVSYDLEVAKLFATYQINKLSGASDSDKVMSISATIPAGPGTVALSYAKSTMDAANASPAGTLDKNASGMTVAWLQSLGTAKTTTFYAAYTRMSQGSDTNSYSVANNVVGGGLTTAGGSSSMLAVGLSKKF